MRIVVDLQGAQTENRFRGIGRYSLALTKALLNVAHNHELWIALNGEFEETIDGIRTALDDLLPQNRIVVFDIPGPVAEADEANC
jgi:O-antigen biosynthesis alpha-1,2-mannosyltransferase